MVGRACLLAALLASACAFERAPTLGGRTRRRARLSRAGVSRVVASDSVQTPPIARDLTGDAGVLKAVLTAGTKPAPRRSATVEIDYTARLVPSGELVDKADAFQFALGQGDVITGFEVAVSAMAVGETALVTCTAAYAYGDVGMDAIPPGATLEYQITLRGVVDPAVAAAKAVTPQMPMASAASPTADAATGQFGGASTIPQRNTMADLERPDIARSPAEIAAAYEARVAERKASAPVASGAPQQVNLLGAIIERFRTAYIFGLFDSQTGEKAPWYLNPLITFPGMFAFVGFGLILVKLTGAVKLGVPGELEVPLF